MRLNDIYINLADNNYLKSCIKRRIIKIVLGPSVIRAFNKNTKFELQKTLVNINVKELKYLLTESQYDKWQLLQVNKVHQALLKLNQNKQGLKWGHSCKIFNLYISHLVLYSRYFTDFTNLDKIIFYLHIPLDSKVLKVLNRSSNFQNKLPNSLSSMTRAYYYHIQLEVNKIARANKCPRFYLDEYAWPN